MLNSAKLRAAFENQVRFYDEGMRTTEELQEALMNLAKLIREFSEPDGRPANCICPEDWQFPGTHGVDCPARKG